MCVGVSVRVCTRVCVSVYTCPHTRAGEFTRVVRAGVVREVTPGQILAERE